VARSSHLVARLIACLALAWQPCSALGQKLEDDTQAWLNLSLEGELDDATAISLDFSRRWREDRRAGEQHTARVTVMREVADGVRIGGGGGIFETEGGGTELRPHQELVLARGRFSGRTRLEERFFDGADRMELRFRQQVRYAQPLGRRTELGVSGEYLGLVQTRERGSAGPRDEWRARVVLSRKVSEALSLGLAYLIIYTPREGAADRVSHIPQAAILYRF
jgi:hypothetical protein